VKHGEDDIPGRQYFSFINSNSGGDSPARNSSFSREFEENKNNLLNFLQKTQRIKEKNILGCKELKNKYKVNFDKIPNVENMLPLFEKIVERYPLKSPLQNFQIFLNEFLLKRRSFPENFMKKI
jgi:hypothetical protein